ncbi:hypothetical protein C8A00DRAFT_38742 [Chaetomidium leptoderma]|uniref:C2H2-type domain-containing protein n=1 Tax=Chaetomidium leptoderma TaxID=669021 RepID=A0AAN6VC25_9PEZI|nr:hypothetical protein C8A00DRAFT_38742 [Chaetomidium leptoderma]
MCVVVDYFCPWCDECIDRPFELVTHNESDHCPGKVSLSRYLQSTDLRGGWFCSTHGCGYSKACQIEAENELALYQEAQRAGKAHPSPPPTAQPAAAAINSHPTTQQIHPSQQLQPALPQNWDLSEFSPTDVTRAITLHQQMMMRPADNSNKWHPEEKDLLKLLRDNKMSYARITSVFLPRHTINGCESLILRMKKQQD